MTTLAHLSDTHFGAADRDAAARLADHINEARVDAVIVTGDLTQSGRKREFVEAAEFLARFEAPTLVVPGNHDVPVYHIGQRFASPWRRYQRYINEDLCPTLALEEVFVCGLNSARRANPSLDWSLGRLSNKQIDLAQQRLRRADEAKLKLVAFHHPAIIGPGRAGRAIINRPTQALQRFSEAGADIILTGHVHIPRAEVHESETRAPLIIAAAGTAASTRLRGEAQSFNLISWGVGRVDIAVQRYGDNGYSTERQHQFRRRDGRWGEC